MCKPDYYGNVANAHPEGRPIISHTIPAAELDLDSPTLRKTAK